VVETGDQAHEQRHGRGRGDDGRRERPIGVGIIGLGTMGRQHIASYAAAHAAGLGNRLVAVADTDADRRAGHAGPRGNLETAAARGAAARAFDTTRVRAYRSVDELLDDREVELVSVCSWTPAHVEHAAAALAARKHVLVEKPVALTPAGAALLAAAARDAETLCMPAMCMRFWPAWSWLQHAIVNGRFGAVRSAVFTRVAAHPALAAGAGGTAAGAAARAFYEDPARCGGVLFDLHVHDADFVRFCFGPPDAVLCGGGPEHFTTLYRFSRGPAAGSAHGPAHVAAEAGWSADPAAPFRMRYTVAFEHATADWDLQREPALMLAHDGRHEPVMLAPGTGYDWEVRHLLAAIARGSRALIAPIDDVEPLTRLLLAEQRSLSEGVPVEPAAWQPDRAGEP
jgi:predicted dehydrogenase